jgi:hypothetical protein
MPGVQGVQGGQGSGGCCTDGFKCVTKNAFYSQCRPSERAMPAGWSGSIVPCVPVS